MVNKLYIIGNGFDLHHGLKTRYCDFVSYLKKKNKELYCHLVHYINVESENKLWSDFEDNLAKLDAERILSDYSDRLPDYTSDEFRDRDKYVFPDIMEEYLEKLTQGLGEDFDYFIREAEIFKDAEDQK